VASLAELLDAYDSGAPLDRASTIPASWYLDPRILDLERRAVFARSWEVVGRADQVQRPGQFVTAYTSSGEPVVVVRGEDGALRGFFNVCRHHAAAVAAEPEGSAHVLRCPYHGWTYALDGSLLGTPDFTGVCDFSRADNGLVPLRAAEWESWVLVAVDAAAPRLETALGSDLVARVAALGLSRWKWMERRRYQLECNWKVFVDNYLDGGYHVPHLHKTLDSVLDYAAYTIENGTRHTLQSSPLVVEGADAATEAVRRGDRASYIWIYPNFMINCYGSAMDTNLVLPLAIDRTEVVFDFYFDDLSHRADTHHRASVAVAERIQEEDVGICASVQRGLRSRVYTSGRLSVRREAGEHLFHRLLAGDLKRGVAGGLA
jgi:choline monooxygenase